MLTIVKAKNIMRRDLGISCKMRTSIWVSHSSTFLTCLLTCRERKLWKDSVEKDLSIWLDVKHLKRKGTLYSWACVCACCVWPWIVKATGQQIVWHLYLGCNLYRQKSRNFQCSSKVSVLLTVLPADRARVTAFRQVSVVVKPQRTRSPTSTNSEPLVCWGGKKLLK